MFGLTVLVVFVVYLLISFLVVRWAIGYARKNGKSAKRWVGGAAFVMYSIVFWDWLPTVAVHQYYCANESGFWVYKTLDQWKAENPGVILTLEGRSTSTQKEEDGYKEIHQLNKRINWVIKHHGVSRILQVSKREEAIVDTKNNVVLARFVDFSRGKQRSTGTTKFWLVSSNCIAGEIYRVHMGMLIDEIYADVKGDKK